MQSANDTLMLQKLRISNDADTFPQRQKVLDESWDIFSFLGNMMNRSIDAYRIVGFVHRHYDRYSH